MNDNDPERRLRAEVGPREHGYVPIRLPASLHADGSGRRPSVLMRTAVLLPAAAAGILVVALVGAVLSGNGRIGLGSGSGSASPGGSGGSSSGLADCRPGDLQLDAEPWGGAAGSRGTVVTVGLAAGHSACRLIGHPGARVLDANARTVVSAEPSGTAALSVNGEGRAQLYIEWSNWCGGQVEEPVSLQIVYGTQAFPLDVPSGTDAVPPCLGGEPTHLFITEERPAP
jgi:hypothetical protein